MPSGLLDEIDLVRSLCRDSFSQFVREFWEEVPGAGSLVWNWHLDVLCDELEKVARKVIAGEPREYDLVINLSPGTSKSSITSILFPAWVWSIFPGGRFICASHTDSLVLDLATKARDVVRSDKYRAAFPHVVLSQAQDAKGNFRNTLGGSRIACTVGGKTPVGFHGHFLLNDDLLDPQKVLSDAELQTARRFIANVLPTRKTDKSVSVTVLVMQRLGMGDSTDVMLEEAAKPGAIPVRHICLPSELAGFDVRPPELAAWYRDGLFDPVRLGPSVIAENRARGEHYYATQFGQRPYSASGGMFQERYFLNRTKAAPYDCKRVRYWDFAATKGEGCWTVGVLMAKAKDGTYYVEHVHRGQWEPHERDREVLAIARKDRLRYGPSHEPTIVIEREGGASGKQAYQHTAGKLAGFRVREDNPAGKGSKEVRAQPWSSQLAAGNVFLVDDGTWDVAEYVRTHCAFPLGRIKDDIDASSGAFLQLVVARPAGTVRSYKLDGKARKGGLHFLLAHPDGLDGLVIEERSLLLHLEDHPGAGAVPPHGCHDLQGSLSLAFDDVDPAELQSTWSESDAGRIMTRDHGKKLWSFLLKPRDPSPQVVLVVGESPRRNRTLAIAACDVLGLPRTAVHDADDPEWVAVAGKEGLEGTNPHVAAIVRATRGMVM